MKKQLQPANSGTKREQSSTKETPLRQESELQTPWTEEQTLRLVHELEAHQIELEMQNKELRRAQEELELSRNKYAELYDFAPVGYFTFDTDGLIKEVNLAGAQLLGIERRLLANKPFNSFIADAKGERDFPQSPRKCFAKTGYAEM